MLGRIADRCDADETLYCELRDNLRVAELYADGAIVVPGLSAAETRDLVACSVGDSAACEAMRYPGLLGDGAHALFSERCDAGEAVYCRLIENLASGG